MRGAVPAGEQIEYERRSSPRRSVSDCPGANANASASSPGTAKVIAAESSVSRLDIRHDERVERGCATWSEQS